MWSTLAVLVSRSVRFQQVFNNKLCGSIPVDTSMKSKFPLSIEVPSLISGRSAPFQSGDAIGKKMKQQEPQTQFSHINTLWVEEFMIGCIRTVLDEISSQIISQLSVTRSCALSLFSSFLQKHWRNIVIVPFLVLVLSVPSEFPPSNYKCNIRLNLQV